MPVPYTSAGAKHYYDTYGTWPKGFTPPNEEKLTDRGKALDRIRSGSGDKADSMFVGLLPRETAPRTLSDYKEALDRTRKGVGDKADSIRVGLRPRETKPETPKPPRPSAEMADSLAAIQFRAMSNKPAPGDTEKIKKYRGIKDAIAGKSIDGFDNKGFREAIDDYEKVTKEARSLADLYFDEPNNPLFGTSRTKLKMVTKKLDSFAIKSLTGTYPPVKYSGKKIRDKMTGRIYQSNGREWISINE